MKTCKNLQHYKRNIFCCSLCGGVTHYIMDTKAQIINICLTCFLQFILQK